MITIDPFEVLTYSRVHSASLFLKECARRGDLMIMDP